MYFHNYFEGLISVSILHDIYASQFCFRYKRQQITKEISKRHDKNTAMYLQHHCP